MLRKLRVSHRMLVIAMPHIVLNSPRIMAVIGQLVAPGMTQHMWIDGKSDLGLLPCSGHHLTDLTSRQRPLALGDKEIRDAWIIGL